MSGGSVSIYRPNTVSEALTLRSTPVSRLRLTPLALGDEERLEVVERTNSALAYA